ncbi:MAG: hypothetical protein EXS05_05155 [Planctomycetaceae bacterium]|nr:hypothetical protein [Planctomycetaceae bacterium]
MIKKSKRGAAPRLDDSRPTKAAAPPAGKRASSSAGDVEVPSYDGPKKTAKMPSHKARRTGSTKAALKPGAVRRPGSGSGDVVLGDQIARSTRGRAKPAAGREQYIRMRIRVHNDRLSVIDSHLVDGPLAQTQVFSGTNAYEVVVGDRLLHAEALPDVGVQRSFVNPAGPPEQHGHYFTDRPIYEFMARVPAHEVSRGMIGKIAVRLYRLKDEARTDRLGSAPLARQFERQIRQIAELVGLPASVLPEAIEERGGRTPSV